jgi:serine protease AprX
MPARSSSVVLAAVAAVTVLQAQEPSAATSVRLRLAAFDPLQQQPTLPTELVAVDANRTWIVQFAAAPTQADRDSIAARGGQVLGYLPDNAYVVRIDAAAAPRLRTLPTVRWLGAYQPGFRLDPRLLVDGSLQRAAAVRYNFVVADKRTDKPALAAKLQAIGATVVDEHAGSLLFSATLTGPQLLRAASFDEVLWIDAWTPSELDVDNARIQGGANFIEAQGGFTGTGVNAHIYEGLEATHPDFTGGVVNVRSGGAADTHGHATAGIVFGNGSSNPAVRGLAPDAGKFYTQYSSVVGSRWQVVSDLVNLHAVSHTTASWGGTLTTEYTSVSAEADDIVFDHDIPWTQSQSNANSRNSRPQAWAKNVISIGGVRHNNNSDPLDDSYLAAGASRGPAADGRIKPDLCAYYDNIGTSDLTGAAGYSPDAWSASFGGTSGATPIVAGHNVLAIQMFTDESATPGFGRFGNALRNPGGSRHSNRPHYTTLKALQIAGARPYTFTAASTDNRREHQGWGFPDLANLWNNRQRTFVVDETDVLQQGQLREWAITVQAGTPALRVAMTYNEPAAIPGAGATLINDLSLCLIAPDGTLRWGNAGLEGGIWSVVGGNEDTINPLECAFVQNPAAGTWRVLVKARRVVIDAHVETPAVDADYALVVIGGTGQPSSAPPLAFSSFTNFGQGCVGSAVSQSACVQLNPTGGSLTGAVRTREYGYTVPNTGTLQVAGFDFYTRSTGGTQVIPAHIYAAVGGVPSPLPLASTTLTVGPTDGFYRATFAAPVAVTGTFYLGVDTSAQTVFVSQLTAGAAGTAQFRNPGTGPWQGLSTLITQPAWRVLCAGGGQSLVPALSSRGLPQFGASFEVTLASALPATFAVLVSGTSDTSNQGLPLPAALPGAPGCNLLVSAEALDAMLVAGDGTASRAFPVPPNLSLVGLVLFHQWAVLDPINPLGIVMSNGGRANFGL